MESSSDLRGENLLPEVPRLGSRHAASLGGWQTSLVGAPGEPKKNRLVSLCQGEIRSRNREKDSSRRWRACGGGK
jgi:hypothetical protein